MGNPPFNRGIEELLRKIAEQAPVILATVQKELKQIWEGRERTAQHNTIWYSDFPQCFYD